jgi:multicomponent Na+:H+ antiporter subunit E
MIWRLAVFSLLWWLLTEGRAEAWPFGLPFIAAAAAVSSLSRPAPAGSGGWRISLMSLLRLSGYFLGHSLLAGVDVAARAFKHPLPLAPTLIDYPLRLPAGAPTVLMAGLVTLMPGTLAMIGRDRLRVHVLDRRGDFARDLRRLEARVAAVFRIDLDASTGNR